MGTPLNDRLQCPHTAPPSVVPSIEHATLHLRLFVEHIAEMNGHDLLPWTFSEHGIAATTCQLCGAEAQVFYRANREPRYVDRVHEPCPARVAHRKQ